MIGFPLLRWVAPVVLPLALAGCGVPDLVAHGVKSWERDQPQSQSQPGNTANPNRAPVGQYQSQAPQQPAYQQDPAPATSPAPVQRESVSVEPLK